MHKTWFCVFLLNINFAWLAWARMVLLECRRRKLDSSLTSWSAHAFYSRRWGIDYVTIAFGASGQLLVCFLFWLTSDPLTSAHWVVHTQITRHRRWYSSAWQTTRIHEHGSSGALPSRRLKVIKLLRTLYKFILNSSFDVPFSHDRLWFTLVILLIDDHNLIITQDLQFS